MENFISFIEGLEIHGYTMKCGILVLNIGDKINGISTIVIDKECTLSDAFQKLSDHFLHHGDMRNPLFTGIELYL
jgi:hypothetical protein